MKIKAAMSVTVIHELAHLLIRKLGFKLKMGISFVERIKQIQVIKNEQL